MSSGGDPEAARVAQAAEERVPVPGEPGVAGLPRKRGVRDVSDGAFEGRRVGALARDHRNAKPGRLETADGRVGRSGGADRARFGARHRRRRATQGLAGGKPRFEVALDAVRRRTEVRAIAAYWRNDHSDCLLP